MLRPSFPFFLPPARLPHSHPGPGQPFPRHPPPSGSLPQLLVIMQVPDWLTSPAAGRWEGLLEPSCGKEDRVRGQREKVTITHPLPRSPKTNMA